MYCRPAHKAAATPEIKLGGKKELGEAKKLMIPPRAADKVPMYGPRIIPIIGAVIAAAVIKLLVDPSIWKIGIVAKMAYNAVKQITRAKSLVVSLLLTGISDSPSVPNCRSLIF